MVGTESYLMCARGGTEKKKTTEKWKVVKFDWSFENYFTDWP